MNSSFSSESNNDFEIQSHCPFFPNYLPNDTIYIDEYYPFEHSFNFCLNSIDDNNNINESISINKKIIEEKRDIHTSSNFNGQKNIYEKNQIPNQNIRNFSITEKQNLSSILPFNNKEKEKQNNDIEILIENNEDNNSEKEREIKEEKEKNKNVFMTKKKKKNNTPKKKKVVFKVKKENTYLGNKRERIIQEEFTYEYNYEYRHTKFSDDNILRKVQVHYMSFIHDFVNNILSSLGNKEQFLKIDYVYKKNVKNEFVSLLKETCIGDILKKEISSKYTKYNRNKNELIFKNVISEHPSLKNLFDKNYYQNERNINLNQYGLNVNIKLNEKKVKLFDDLLKKNIKSNLKMSVFEKPHNLLLLQFHTHYPHNTF